MNLRKFLTPILLLFIVVTSCKKDDDTTVTLTPDRDRQEVYDEDIIEIEEYLETHTFNYDEFLANPMYSDLSTTPGTITPNDEFELEFSPIPDGGTQLSIKSFLNATNYPKLIAKTVTEFDVDYTLYILQLRGSVDDAQAEGSTIHPLDEAVVAYKGFLPSGEFFDNGALAVNPASFNLTTIGNVFFGVVTGFREGLIEFKTRVGLTENVDFGGNPDGTVTHHNHGIGAAFVPSGLGYFRFPPSGIIPSYSPIFFSFKTISRNDTDYEQDNVPSHIEDLNNDGDGFDDDTDGDGSPNFLDGDDDADGVPTKDEDVDDSDPTIDSDGDGDFTNDNRDGDGDPTNDDTDNDGIPNYLDDDDDDDGILSINEDANNDGLITNDDTDGDGIPNYLDPDN